METETPTEATPEVARAVRSDSVTTYLTGIKTVLSSIVADIEVQLKAINELPVDTSKENNVS